MGNAYYKKKEYENYLVGKQRDQQINDLLRTARNSLKQLYASHLAVNEMRAAKKVIFADVRVQYEKLKKSWHGYSGFDNWMYKNLNNAHLLLVATYHDLVPAFKRMLQEQNNDMKKFYQAVEKMGELDKEQREKQLALLKTYVYKN